VVPSFLSFHFVKQVKTSFGAGRAPGGDSWKPKPNQATLRNFQKFGKKLSFVKVFS
jgi:hypothetical protein